MDVIEKFSARFSNEILPLVKWEVEIAYVITMVLMAVKSADIAWHKANLFYSYLRALLYVRGADIILALCTGKSPIEAISCNCTLLTVAAVWWLVLFVPFDIFNRLLNFQTGDVKPFVILLALMTTVRRVMAVDAAVTESLKSYPNSYISVLVGTLAGNGSLVVAAVFGDFAKSISTQNTTISAFVVAVLLSAAKISCPKAVSADVALAFAAILILLLEVFETFGQKVELFEPIYEIVRKIVVTCDLVNN